MGRPQFANPGSKGALDEKVRVANRPEVSNITVENTDSVASGGTETIEFFAPSGSIYRVRALKMDVPSVGSATTGTQRFALFPMGAWAVMWGEGTYNNRTSFDRGYWWNADSISDPPTAAAQQAVVESALASENSPLEVKYKNDTDASQSGRRSVQLVVEEESY